MKWSGRDCQQFVCLFSAADISLVPADSVLSAGSHHHETQTVLDAAHVSRDVAASVEAGWSCQFIHKFHRTSSSE